MASTSGSSSLDTRRTTTLLSTPPSLLSQFSSPLPTRSYSRQYAALYDFRLRKLRRGRLLQKAKERWEGGGSAAAGGVAKGQEEKKTAAGIKHTARILDVKKGQVTYVSGIVYVEMRLKPDVLADLSREAYLPPLPPVTSYSDPTTDSIYLEDESGRLKLVGPLLTDPAQRGLFVTGTVGAFLGTERENGEFHVQDVCWPGLPLRSEKTGGLSKGSEIKMEEDAEQEDREDDEYVVLTSGLDLGGGDGEMGFAAAEMRLSLLAEWIGGEIGDDEHRRKSSRIAGLIIAGNLMTTAQSTSSLSSSATDSTTPSTDAPVASTSKASSSSSSAKLSKQASSQANANLTPSPAEVLLAHLVPLSASLPIVLMPGATDPASAALPQQAVHRAVLRGAGKWAGSSSSSKGGGEGGSGSSSKTNGDAKAPKRSAPGDAEDDDDAEGEQAAGGIHLYNNPSWIQFSSGASASSSSGSSRAHRTRILASSGQNLDDVLKYLPSASKAREAAVVAASASQEADVEASGSKKEEDVEMGSPDDEEEEEQEDERLRAACRLLEYGHIAPTAPDTLWCFPFTDRDPFLLSSPAQIPDVFLIGNQPQFATTLWKQEGEEEGKGVGVQVVLVPPFAKTGEVGLLNLRTRGVRRGRVGWEM